MDTPLFPLVQEAGVLSVISDPELVIRVNELNMIASRVFVSRMVWVVDPNFNLNDRMPGAITSHYYRYSNPHEWTYDIRTPQERPNALFLRTYPKKQLAI